MKYLPAYLSALSAAFILSACSSSAQAPSEPQKIDVANVAKGSIERKVLFTGNIAAEDAFEVFPRASGKVARKLVKEGDPVKRGQAILLVDRDEVGYTYRPMPVVSPADGLVGRINVDAGSDVDSKTAVATIVHPGRMRVKLDIPERYLAAILPGTDVELMVDYLDGEVFKGTISTSSPVIDQKTRTGRVEIELPNSDGKLRHGMFGRMNLAVERHEGILIAPLDAISWEGANQFVYRVDGDRVKRVPVKTALRDDLHVEITEGISEGEALARGNLIDLEDGEAVNVANGGLDE